MECTHKNKNLHCHGSVELRSVGPWDGIALCDTHYSEMNVLLYTGQSKRHSVYEAILSTIAGTIIAFVGQLVFFPMFGVEANIAQNIGITLCFTALSTARTYLFRRIFNWIGNKIDE